MSSSFNTVGISSAGNTGCPSVSLDSRSVGSWDLKGSRYSVFSGSSRITSSISGISAYSHMSAPDDTYINASFLSDASAAISNCSQVGYIATQGPLPNTVTDFWRMVTAANVSAIVMLTELCMNTIGHGSNRAMCAAYYPDGQNDVLELPGGFTITCVYKKQLTDSLLFRQLEVVCPAATQPASQLQQPQQEKRMWVNHYKLAGWPDSGVPCNTRSVRALSQALDSCRRGGCKIVAHCSAGVGRTGTFIGEPRYVSICIAPVLHLQPCGLSHAAGGWCGGSTSHTAIQQCGSSNSLHSTGHPHSQCIHVDAWSADGRPLHAHSQACYTICILAVSFLVLLCIWLHLMLLSASLHVLQPWTSCCSAYRALPCRSMALCQTATYAQQWTLQALLLTCASSAEALCRPVGSTSLFGGQ